MIVEFMRWRHARVPFVQRFGNAQGTRSTRDLTIVEAGADDGSTGWGEASPWPAPGAPSVADVDGAMCSVARELVGSELEAALAALATTPMPQAVRYGVELALLDLAARAAGVSIAALFGGSPPAAIRSNALIDTATPAAAADAALRAKRAGYRTIKLKVGALPIDDDVARVAAVRQVLGHLRDGAELRLDANGAWTRTEALVALERLAVYGIEYLEQPCATIADCAAARAARTVRIAIDEPVDGIASARAVVAAEAADVLIVKPAAVGGLRSGRAIVAMAAAAGVPCVVTTSIESGIGIAGAWHLAATLPSEAPVAGLATAHVLADDLTGGLPHARAGAVVAPPEPGLGVRPDPDRLERYAVRAARAIYRESRTA